MLVLLDIFFQLCDNIVVANYLFIIGIYCSFTIWLGGIFIKKILTFCLIALLILYVTSLVSSASENTTSEEWIIQIDIHEFLNNKDYYTSLT